MSKQIKGEQFRMLQKEQLLALANALVSQIKFKDRLDRSKFKLKYGNIDRMNEWSKNKIINFLLQFNPSVNEKTTSTTRDVKDDIKDNNDNTDN